MLKSNLENGFLFLLPLALVLSASLLISCGGSSDSDKDDKTPEQTPPATEHHENDRIETNITSTLIIGNNTVVTRERNFSHESKVTDAMKVSSMVGETHSIMKKLKYIGIQDSYLVGWETSGAYDSSIVSYSLSNKKIIEEDKPDFNISGLSFNGFIMSVDGAEDVNFYHMDKGVMGNHFFHIKDITGEQSKFLSTAYLDHNYAYVYNSDEIIRVPLSDTTKHEKVIAINDFNTIAFTSDEKFLYIANSDFTEARVVILNKKDNSIAKTLDLPNVRAISITVDANYIYVSDKLSGDVLVYNKHTLNDSGKIVIGADTYIDYANNKLYIYRDDTQVVEEHTVTFAP